MSYRFPLDADMMDDDSYQFVPGVGRVRSAPRRSGYWESRQEYDMLDSLYSHQNYDSYRPQYRVGTQDDPFRSGFGSSQERTEAEERVIERHARPQTAANRELSEERHTPSHTFRKESSGFDDNDPNLTSHTQVLSQLFAAAQRNRSSDEAVDDVFDWRDSRRSDEHLPGRQDLDTPRIKQEPGEAQNVYSNRSVSSRGNNYADGRRSPNHPRRIKQEDEADDNLVFRPTPNRSADSSLGSGYDADSANRRSQRSASPRDSPEPEFPIPPMPQPEIPALCVCPIDLECPARADHLIDCRTLVLEWKQWHSRQSEGGVEDIPEDVDPEDEEFVPLQGASRIVCLINCVSRHPAGSNLIKATFIQLRKWIGTMSTKSVTEIDLHASNALPTLMNFLSDANRPFRVPKRVPMGILEDLTILKRKWEFGDSSQLPRRGLIRSSPGNPRSPLHPDPNWPFRQSARFFGHGHLVNGQKWNSRAAIARDGGHGPLIAGISGGRADGAYSVVMGYHDEYRQDFYADVDCGNRIFYLSTALPKLDGDRGINESNHKDLSSNLIANPDLATTGAQALMRSAETGKPVRVFRSFRAAKICPHRPKGGFRYDGLYQVVDYECLKVERLIYRFEMVRMAEANDVGDGDTQGQGPIRSGIVAEPISNAERVEIRRRRREREREAARGRRR